MTETIRVLIAEDSPDIREGISGLLSAFPDFEVVGAATNGREAVQMSADLAPDVILMDARMPVMDGVEAAKQIKGSGALTGILFLSVYTDCMEAALAAGADGFLLKDCALEELLSKIRKIAAKTKAVRRLRDPNHRTCGSASE